MAHITNSAPIAWPLGFLSAVGQAFQSVYLALSIAGSYDSRMQQIDKLNALSDEELAAKGLTRDRIVHHVFRDIYYV